MSNKPNRAVLLVSAQYLLKSVGIMKVLRLYNYIAERMPHAPYVLITDGEEREIYAIRRELLIGGMSEHRIKVVRTPPTDVLTMFQEWNSQI
ncbi:hypothetical protein LCGC14_2381680 [marine sediment metagenome]|uniref:Uncharacterized protein n=1 Tax=marine sediment metagenome TaxID=412755 RepID=A0A0F9EVI3_9ZZZZ